MLEILSLSQYIVVIGFLLLVTAIFIGAEAGIEMVFMGSILILGGLIGSFTQSNLVVLVVCSILGLAYIVFGRTYIHHKISTTAKTTNADRLIGSQGTVVKTITPEKPGLIRLDDEDWRATSTTIVNPGNQVTVTAVSGVTLTVKPSAS
jgi:membrane protein implicated in regulation of membrane protease activity